MELVVGWQSTPNNRGTLDIIYSCIATIVVCSWSCVCLNIPEPGTTRMGSFMLQLRWQLFTIFFPEVTVAIAAEQWESANQSIERFKDLGHADQWTRAHAFFADMGGILLKAPEFPPFPVDSQQLAYLIERRYLEMPSISSDDIADRNKADGLARVLAVAQILWFTAQCIGRWIQGLGLCTLELSTIIFILCTLNIYFFWYFKPLNVYSTITLEIQHPIDTILLDAGETAGQPYSRTPLDFIKPPPDDKSLIAPFWFGVGSIFPTFEDPGHRPIRYFRNHRTIPPKGITFKEALYGIFLECLYFGLHFIGLLLEFPTEAERFLWIAATSTLTGLFLIYLLGIFIGHKLQSRVAMWLFQKETKSILQMVEILPRWLTILIHGPIFILYIICRTYILIEGFVGLRALQARLYFSVEWANFIPHL
ncbi:hypothetical protein F53441_13032 [Fusarium austroafricanum]|uniref:Transmembrane protein n=1 Tax=Fusarium austroafricanum TaxID=2364996 RepID=A0A8H4JSR8_9HYPO|nr:hypothetical protein F53441_13032 [Fusarium austroafricanum]